MKQRLELPIKNQILALQEPDLRQWFAQTEHSLHPQKTPLQDENIPELSTRLLGRFGLKNANDVSRFLNSPAGKTVFLLISEELSKLESIKKNLSFQWQEKERKDAVEIALLMLGLIYEDKEKAKQLNEEAEAIIEKIKHQAQKPPTLENAFVNRAEDHNEIPPVTVDILERALNTTLQESELIVNELEENLLTIDQELEKISLKYQDLHLFMDNIHQAFNDPTTAAHALELDRLTPFLPQLRAEKKLILENGKRYLLREDQAFTTLTQEEKENASRTFESLQSDLQMVPNLLRRNKKDEEQKHLTVREALYEKMDNLQNKLLLLNKQLIEVKTAVIETNLLSKAPTPTPKPTPQPTSQPETDSIARSYRMVLRLMEKHPSQNAINWVRNRADDFTGGPKNSVQTMRALINDLRAGVPVPRSLTDAMAKNETQNTAEAPFSTPSPFSMKPR